MDSLENEGNQITVPRPDSPLCLFYFSYPFSIGDPSCNLPPDPSVIFQPGANPEPSCNDNENVPVAIATTRSLKNRNVTADRKRKRFAKKRNAWTLVKYLTESIRLQSRRNKLPCLEDVVNTLQAAWLQDNDFVKCSSGQGSNQDGRMAHEGKDKPPYGFQSPVLLRRRLSAPETIMRKYTLSQQRSDSTESDSTQLSSNSPFQSNNNAYWNRTSATGSESNLSLRKPYKKDPDLMRKSTLLRRMWSREFTGSISRLNNEEIYPKKNSLTMKSQSRSPVRSIRLSPEHGNKERVNGKFSPERTRLNGDAAIAANLIKTKWEPVPEMNSYSSYASDVISRVSSTSESNKSVLETSSTDIKVSSLCTTTSTENDSFSCTRTTTETSGSHMDDNSDSAYTKTQTYSTFSSSKSPSENNNNDNAEFDEIAPKQTHNANHIEQDQSHSKHLDPIPITQPPHDLNSNNNSATPVAHKSNDYKWNNQRSDVNDAVPKIDEQSGELNIVNLSAATLNIIINNSPEVRENINIARIADPLTHSTLQAHSVGKPESFYLKRKEDVHISAEHSRLIKYMISNVGAGSSYRKPTETPQLVVPRYSALPRSVSMEVNTSSADSTDKESDTASLVDSLDDPNSPRQSALTPRIKYDDKPVRGDLSALLPDNSISNKDTPRAKPQRGDAFYVSIVQDETPDNVKTVAEHLPERVRNKLSKRQEIMEQKKLSAKKTENQNLDPNGNQEQIELKVENRIPESVWPNNETLKKVKKEKKMKNPLQSLPSYKVNARGELTLNPNATMKIKRNLNKQVKRKYNKNSESSESSTNTVTLRHSMWNRHAHLKSNTVENKTDFNSEPEVTEIVENSNFNNQNFNNRIEILEIMECVEQPVQDKSLSYQRNNVRSKIPVPVQYKVPDVSHRQIQMQAVYHAYNITRTPEHSPKTDQLIANILIDALNTPEMNEVKVQDVAKAMHHQPNEIRPVSVMSNKQVNRYNQKFEIIPEEKLSSMGSSQEDAIIAIVEDRPLNPTSSLITEKKIAKSIEMQTEEQVEIKKIEETNVVEKKTLADVAIQTDLPIATTELSHRIPNPYKGKAALAMMKDEDFSTIPKGWITFYMLRKSPGSPDSSIDEGMNAEAKNNNLEEKTDSLELRELRPVMIKRRINNKENLTDLLPDNDNKNNNFKENDPNRSLFLERPNDLVLAKKEHYSSSSENSKTHSPNDHDLDQRSACPLPIALPTRQGRRQSHRRGRYKTSSQSQSTNSSQMPGGWSVTVSGTNSCGQPAPDLEMRLKFPCPQPQSQSDSGLGEEHPRPPRRNFEQQQADNDFHLPPAKPPQNKRYTVITKKHNTDDLADDLVNSRSFQYLPDLIKNKGQKTAKRRDCSVPVTRRQQASRQASSLDLVTPMPPLNLRGLPTAGSATLKPRQTLTSYRRFSLHHSRHLSPQFRSLLPTALSADNIHTQDIIDLPECFPAILAVTGNAISPENKPRVPTMSEKDLTRNHFNFGQHHA